MSSKELLCKLAFVKKIPSHGGVWYRYLKKFQVPTFERRSLKPEVTDVQQQQHLGT